MATPWREIKHKFSEEERVRIQQEAVAELERMGFGKLRLARQQTSDRVGGNCQPCTDACPRSETTDSSATMESVSRLL